MSERICGAFPRARRRPSSVAAGGPERATMGPVRDGRAKVRPGRGEGGAVLTGCEPDPKGPETPTKCTI